MYGRRRIALPRRRELRPTANRPLSGLVFLFSLCLAGCSGPEPLESPDNLERAANVEYSEEGTAKSVRIKFVKLSPDMLSKIQAEPSLEIVEINECPRDNVPLLCEFSKLEQLQELTLNHVPLVDEELEQLAGCQQLRSLELSQTGITGEGLKHLAHLPIKRLAIRGFTLTKEGLRCLTAFDQLEELELFLPQLDAADLPPLSELNNLRSLSLHRLQYSYREYGGLSKLIGADSLQRIELSGSKLNKRVYDALALLPNVSQLYISNSRVNDEALQVLGRLKHLRVLRMDFCEALTDQAPVILSEFQQLQELALEGTTLKGSQLSHLIRLPHLRRFDLRGLTLDVDIARHFESLAKQANISFSHGDGMDYMARRR